jgi:hypothetical protein
MLAAANIKDRKIAWSEVGTIAYINNDDVSVSVQVHVQTSSGRFKLSAPTLLDLLFHQNDHITHLEFSHQGLELAVVDRSGRLSIHNAGQDGINRLVMTAEHDVEPMALHDPAILALKWQAGLCPVRQLNAFHQHDIADLSTRPLFRKLDEQKQDGPLLPRNTEHRLDHSTHIMPAPQMLCSTLPALGFSTCFSQNRIRPSPAPNTPDMLIPVYQ